MISLLRVFAVVAIIISFADSCSLFAAEPARIGARLAGDDWPQFLGPERNGKSRETGIITKWPADGPKVLWSRKLGTGYSVGSTAYGRFYQFDKLGDEATLLCLNAETGDELWKFGYRSEYADLYGYNDGPRCAPLIAGEYVYLFGVEGMLHCLRAESGKLVWKRDTATDFGVVQNFFGVGSSPIVCGEHLIVMVGGSPEESHRLPPGQLDRVRPNGSAIVAFEKTTGKTVYRLGDDLASYSSLQSADIGGRTYGLALCREGLIAFEPQSGKLDFHFPWRAKSLESVNASMPVVFGEHVFLSETYGPGSVLLKLVGGIEKIAWADDPKVRAKAMQTHWNTAIYHEGYLYGSSGRHTENAELRCIEALTGKVQWSEPNMSRTSLLYVDGHFLSLGEYGDVTFFKADVRKFTPIARYDFPDRDRTIPLLKYPCWSAPILSHGLLYLRGDDRLLCVELIPAK